MMSEAVISKMRRAIVEDGSYTIGPQEYDQLFKEWVTRVAPKGVITDHIAELESQVQGLQAEREQLPELIARKIFELGGEPNSPCNRIQFLGGSYVLKSEVDQGGTCESALVTLIREALTEHKDAD